MNEAIALLRRFLEEGEYNDEGNYVFISDTPETGPQSEPGTKIPKLVADVISFLKR